MPDPESILRMAPVSDEVRADAWDAFQGSKTKDDLAAKLKDLKLPESVKADLWDLKTAPAGSTGSILPAIATVAADNAPSIASAVYNVGSNPNLAKNVGTVARVGTQIAGLVHGAYTGNIPEILQSPLSAWGAGKGGYYLGKAAQGPIQTVANALTDAAPYIEKAVPALSAGNITSLAQTLEPDRKDIGVMGIGASSNPTVDPGMITANTQAHQDRWAREAADRQERVMKWAEKMPASVRASFLALMGGR